MGLSGLTVIDLLIIIAYLVFITWKGFGARGTHQSTDDFFLANRSLSWPLIGLSLYATNISSSSIIGLTSSGYETGISVFNYEWTGAIMMIIFAAVIVPYYLRVRLTTMPEYLEYRFDARSRYYFSVISIIANVVIDISSALYASSIILKGIFPGIDIYIFVIFMAVITGLYTLAGGLKAVVVTDSIQAILLTLGMTIIAFITFQKIGSWDQVTAALDPDFLSLIRPTADPLIPWPTLFISLPILGFYFMCTNQHMVQRVLGAKTVEDGRKGIIFAGFLKLPLLFIVVMPGTFGRIFYPELENANMVFSHLMFDFLPAGVLGLVLTGFVAALMSSIDSTLTAAASIATLDIYKKFNPFRDEKHLLMTGRVFIVIFVIIASLWAPFIDQFPTLWEYLQAVLSYLIPPVVTCFVFGLFWKKATADGAFYSLIIGNIFAVLLIVNNYFYTLLVPIHYLYSATIIFAISSITMIAITLYSKGGISKSETLDFFGFYKSDALEWYRSYKLYAVLLLILTALLVWVFR